MFKTISFRLGILFVLFTALLAGSYLWTDSVLSRQAEDGLVINLAGRQRMLTQKLTKELLIFSTMPDGPRRLAQRDQINATIGIFDTTLNALRSGGAAPLDLDGAQLRECPPAEGDALRQLESVATVWEMYRRNIDRVVASNGTDRSALAHVTSNDDRLLSEMNTAVGMMQAESEARVSSVTTVLILSLVIGLMISVFGYFAVRGAIIRPLDRLLVAAERMSTGDIEHQIQVKGTIEIESLSDAFERLRLSIASMVDMASSDTDDDDDFDDL